MDNWNIVYCEQKHVSETDSALKIESLLSRCFGFPIRALKIDSLLYTCCVASINRTEAGQPPAVYPGFSS
jgi:hypothetical protein